MTIFDQIKKIMKGRDKQITFDNTDYGGSGKQAKDAVRKRKQRREMAKLSRRKNRRG
ncbi:hypothetical protein LCGC14_1416570 [marine sediment metagenome]|uniref:Uncharacterized protein n=1 Tax=marine sediment metagenome TaxID=412755 RepID=A0A0F9KDW7_9ZZZZ